MLACGVGGLLLALSGCDVALYHDLTERRANEAMLLLRESGLHADKQQEQRGSSSHASSFALVVPRAEESRALQLLTQRGLPRVLPRPLATAGRFLGMPLSGEAHAESTFARELSLSDTLESLPAVEEAHVHLALPEPEPLSPLGQLRPTAAVLLKLRAPLPITSAQVAELVARAVPGLEAADVAVVSAPLPAVVPATATAATLATSLPSWLLPLLISLLVLLGGACVALLTALRRRSLPSVPASLPPGSASFVSETPAALQRR